MQLTLEVGVCVGFDPGTKAGTGTKSHVRMKHCRYRANTN